MKNLLGKSVLFIMTDGEDVLLKVNSETLSMFKGIDDEGLNTKVNKSDISDYMVMG